MIDYYSFAKLRTKFIQNRYRGKKLIKNGEDEHLPGSCFSRILLDRTADPSYLKKVDKIMIWSNTVDFYANCCVLPSGAGD